MKALEKLEAMVKSGATITIRLEEEGVATTLIAVCSVREETLIKAISKAYELACNKTEQRLRHLRGGG